VSPVHRRVRRLTVCTLLSVVAHVWGVCPALAQTRRSPPGLSRPSSPAPHAGSWELSGGLLWQAGFDLGDGQAGLTQGASGTRPYELFRTASRLGPGAGVQGRLAGYLSRQLAIEGGFRLTRPTLTIDLTEDAESAPDVSAGETLTQYVVKGSLLWHLGAFNGGRSVPFVAGGAGYIRDLHEGSELVETGTEYHALVGLKWWFSGRPRRLGVRGEAGFSIRDGGFDFREERRTVPIASVSLAYLF
jgi:hypothetical protein